MTLSVGSLFSGIGGMDLGLERAGLQIRWQVEIDPDAVKVLERHWPDVRRYRDVREVDGGELEPVDLIAFGSPCQGLSVAGKRRGFEDERSGLYYEAIRIIRAVRPTFALWENVPGALSSNRGHDFGAALDALAESGALDIAWAVLDAQWFGVAQRRRRVFVVADFGGERAAEILAIPDGSKGDTPPRREAGKRVAATLSSGSTRARGVNDTGRRREDDVNLVAHTLTAEGHDASEDGTDRGVPLVYQCHGSNVGPMGALRRGNGHAGGGVPFVASPLTASYGKTTDTAGSHSSGPKNLIAFSVNQRREGRLRHVHGSLNGQPSGTQIDGVIDGYAVRRLTPLECTRLMGLPDDWFDGTGLSDSARYRTLGNAVVANVAEWIGRRLLEAAR